MRYFFLPIFIFMVAGVVQSQQKLPQAKFSAEPVTKPKHVVMVPLRPDDPAEGPRFAKVTIVEFSDFECPFCATVASTLKRIAQMYPSAVRIVWKHAPLPFHPNAVPAAEAAEAAREQGKFWLMHDLLFQSQKNLNATNYENWAKQIGLNLEPFQRSMREHANRARIQQDTELAGSLHVTGTPTSFVNGRCFVGAHSFETFKILVEDEVSKADELIKQRHRLDASFYELMVQKNIELIGE